MNMYPGQACRRYALPLCYIKSCRHARDAEPVFLTCCLGSGRQSKLQGVQVMGLVPPNMPFARALQAMCDQIPVESCDCRHPYAEEGTLAKGMLIPYHMNTLPLCGGLVACVLVYHGTK